MDVGISILVGLHNIVRWLWVVAAVVVLFWAYRGWIGKSAYTALQRRASLIFVSLMDTQLLLGGILYFIGNWGVKAFDLANQLPADQKMGALYFALEHATTMIIALVVAHVGSVMVKRAADDGARQKLSAIWFTIVVLLVLVAIPWMDRPLLPGF